MPTVADSLRVACGYWVHLLLVLIISILVGLYVEFLVVRIT